jgi:hypothetical protein
MLIRTMTRLLTEFPSSSLVLIGEDGRNVKEGMTMLKPGLEARIHITGRIQQLTYLSRCPHVI